MPAPVPAASPHTPAGIRIENGHPTIITFENDADISLWETEVTPPGIDGGDANDLTTMHNVAWRTYAARTLMQLTEVGATVQWAAAAYTQVLAIINDPTTVTIHLPGGHKLAFFGYLRAWTPEASVEGEPPTATAAVFPTNRDPSDDSEQPPVFVAASSMMRAIGRRFVPVGKTMDKGITAQEAMHAATRIPRRGKPAQARVTLPRPPIKQAKDLRKGEEKLDSGNKA